MPQRDRGIGWIGRLLTITAIALLGCGSLGATTTKATPAMPKQAKAAFPLHVGPGQRYLADAEDRPFLIQGDSAWSLIVQLKREDVDRYLADRQARGFNTLLVSLLEHRFASKAPANAYGDPPFLKADDFATPNDAYFAHADWVLRRAAERGFLVLLTPSYLGGDGGDEGWYREMAANGAVKLRQYGEYLGQRYRDFNNILWVHGGDYNPPDKSLVRAIAEGIAAFDSRALHTAHGAPETAALDYWKGEPWLQVNNVYTYKPVYASALKQYVRPEQMPFFLIESAYEHEHRTTEQRLRTQAFHALLSGAAGQVFGNNPIWHFDAPGLIPSPVTWQQALADPGSQSMTHISDLFAALRWWLMEPDIKGIFVTGGADSGSDRAVSARARDRSFAMVYLPQLQEVTLNLSELAGPRLTTRWYDPSNGVFSDVAGSPIPAAGKKSFRPTGQNHAGSEDWVLLLESKSE